MICYLHTLKTEFEEVFRAVVEEVLRLLELVDELLEFGAIAGGRSFCLLEPDPLLLRERLHLLVIGAPLLLELTLERLHLRE